MSPRQGPRLFLSGISDYSKATFALKSGGWLRLGRFIGTTAAIVQNIAVIPLIDLSEGRFNTMIDFFFDCSSPWTYLAFHNIQPLAAEFGEHIQWRPILVGGVFNAINPSVYAGRDNPVPAKERY